MNIKAAMTGLMVGLSLIGVNISSTYAIPLTMSFSVNITDPVTGTIKYDTDGITLDIDTLTFVDLTLEGHTYDIAELTYGNTGAESQIGSTYGTGFQLTFNHDTGEALNFSYGQNTGSFNVAQIPEPTTLALLGLGLTLLGAASRRKQ